MRIQQLSKPVIPLMRPLPPAPVLPPELHPIHKPRELFPVLQHLSHAPRRRLPVHRVLDDTMRFEAPVRFPQKRLPLVLEYAEEGAGGWGVHAEGDAVVHRERFPGADFPRFFVFDEALEVVFDGGEVRAREGVEEDHEGGDFGEVAREVFIAEVIDAGVEPRVGLEGEDVSVLLAGAGVLDAVSSSDVFFYGVGSWPHGDAACCAQWSCPLSTEGLSEDLFADGRRMLHGNSQCTILRS